MDIKQLVDAFNSVANVIKTVANTPGVNMIPYATTVAAAVGALQSAVAAGVNILPYVQAIKETFEGGVPTQGQLDSLDAKIAELEAKVQAPLPPREDGEPE